VQRAVDAELAYNTVQTILARLYDKAWSVAPPRPPTSLPPGQGRRGAGRRADAGPAAAGPDRQSVLQRFATSLSEEDAEALRAMLKLRRRRR